MVEDYSDAEEVKIQLSEFQIITVKTSDNPRSVIDFNWLKLIIFLALNFIHSSLQIIFT